MAPIVPEMDVLAIPSIVAPSLGGDAPAGLRVTSAVAWSFVAVSPDLVPVIGLARVRAFSRPGASGTMD